MYECECGVPIIVVDVVTCMVMSDDTAIKELDKRNELLYYLCYRKMGEAEWWAECVLYWNNGVILAYSWRICKCVFWTMLRYNTMMFTFGIGAFRVTTRIYRTSTQKFKLDIILTLKIFAYYRKKGFDYEVVMRHEWFIVDHLRRK